MAKIVPMYSEQKIINIVGTLDKRDDEIFITVDSGDEVVEYELEDIMKKIMGHTIQIKSIIEED